MRKVTMLVLMLVALIVVPAPAAFAFDEKEKGCAATLLECFYQAAAIDDWLERWAAGLDCELDFVECARIKIRGY